MYSGFNDPVVSPVYLSRALFSLHKFVDVTQVPSRGLTLLEDRYLG